MTRPLTLGLLLLALPLFAGCVERRYLVITDPPGAIVYNEKNYPVGGAPVDQPFTYYGKYRFTLVGDGFQTQVVEESIAPPWYECGPLEFVNENLIPWTIRDIRTFRYQLQPVQIVPPETVIQQGSQLRERGKAIPSSAP